MKAILTLLPALFLVLNLNSAKLKPSFKPDNTQYSIMVKRIIPAPPGMVKFVWAGTITDHGNC